MSAGAPVRMIFIGASTGGIEALHVLLAGFAKEGVTLPLAIALHLPAGFTAGLAKGLTQATAFKCEEAVHGQQVNAATAYFAPSGRQLAITNNGSALTLLAADTEPVDFCLPSVNTLLCSAALALGAQAIGVVLTGMGSDGTRGARDLAASGAKIFIQDEASSLIWGMPRSIAQANIPCIQLPLDRLAYRIAHLIKAN